MRVSWPVVAAASLGVLVATRDAAAFCRSTTCTKGCETDVDGCPSTGLQLWWKTACIGYSVDPQLTQNLPGAPTRDALDKAFFAWADLDCGGGKRASITFARQPDFACRRAFYRPDGSNVNLVLFKDDDWTYRGIDGTLAKTTVTFDAKTGEILDADIEVNSAYNNLTVGDAKIAYDLQAIMTHEVGHLLGLAHSSDFAATMFASYEPGTTDLRSLASDDVKAVCAAYPPGRPANCDTTPRGGLATDCPADPSAEPDGGCSVGRSTRAASGRAGHAPWPLASLVVVAGLAATRVGARRTRRPAGGCTRGRDLLGRTR
jgi:hypothetical protein